MVSAPVILQALNVLAFILNGIAALVLQYVDHPDDQYGEKVEKLQKDRWSEVSTELGDLLAQIEDLAENSSENNEQSDSESDEDVTPEAKYSLVVQSELNRDELDGLEDKLEDVDDPREQIQRCRKSRDVAGKRFILGLFGALIAIVFAFLLPIIGMGILVAAIVSGVFLGLSIGVFISALNRARHWLNARQQLDNMWEKYKYM